VDARPRQQLVVDGPTLLLLCREDDGCISTADLFLDFVELLPRGQGFSALQN